jgi:hypothetical protein
MSIEQIRDAFDDAGWCLATSVFPEKAIAKLKAFLIARQHLMHQQFEEWVGRSFDEQDSYALHQTRLDSYVARGLPEDLRHYLTGEFDLETRLDNRISDLLSLHACRAFLCTFLKSDRYYVHYPPMIRFKIAEAPSNLVPLHQDAAYSRHLKDFVTAWVPLVDITEECGGVIVHEGTHRMKILEHRPSGAWANKAAIDGLRAEATRHILMNAGDVLLFAPQLLHESAPHRTNYVRYSIDFRIFRHESDTTKSYYDPFTRAVRRLH